MLRHVLAYVTFILPPSSGLHCASNGCLVHWFCLSRCLQGTPGGHFNKHQEQWTICSLCFAKHPRSVFEGGVSGCPRLWLPESLVTLTSINRLTVFILVERFVVCFLIFFLPQKCIWARRLQLFFLPCTVGEFLPLYPMEVTKSVT